MRDDQARANIRRLCYAVMPLGVLLIVPAFSLMPNRHHGAPILEQGPAFQLGFLLAALGFILVAVALLVLVLWAEE